jgi:hypothetical protein
VRVLLVYKCKDIINFYTWDADEHVISILERGHSAIRDGNISEDDFSFWADFPILYKGRRVYSNEHHADILVGEFHPPVKRMFFIDTDFLHIWDIRS